MGKDKKRDKQAGKQGKRHKQKLKRAKAQDGVLAGVPLASAAADAVVQAAAAAARVASDAAGAAAAPAAADASVAVTPESAAAAVAAPTEAAAAPAAAAPASTSVPVPTAPAGPAPTPEPPAPCGVAALVLKHLSAAPAPAATRTATGAYDLHNHSTFSDSSVTVDALIDAARAAGLARIAITDHDATSQLSVIRQRSRELGFPVLAGLEVSSIDPATARKVHILAFGIEAAPDGSGPLDQMVARTLYRRTANTLWQAWVLKRHDAEFSGKRISLDEIVATAGQSTGIYKQHLMEALTGRHHDDPDYQFFYRCQLKGGGPADHEISYPTAADAVRAVREQGGVPVLAHPGQMNSWGAIPELVRAGLMGIEAYHPDHGPVEQALAFEAASRYGLLVTGGSDYHGKYGSSPGLGTAFVMPEEAGDAVEELFCQERRLS